MTIIKRRAIVNGVNYDITTKNDTMNTIKPGQTLRARMICQSDTFTEVKILLRPDNYSMAPIYRATA